MLECVINVAEGRSDELLSRLAEPAAGSLLDVHADADHHRSVFTLGGPSVEEAARGLTERAVALLDLRTHTGAHPRLGVVDVVPFVPLDGDDLTPALAARERFADWAATTLGLPSFFYGPERSLPDVRRRAFADLLPDRGPARAHPSAGACSVGARLPLVAYNVWLDGGSLQLARAIAADLRGPAVRALGLDLAGRAQVSCNLVSPTQVGPAAVYDAVAARAPVARAELVGLVPRVVLEPIPPGRWAELDVGEDRTIEARLAAAAAPAPALAGGDPDAPVSESGTPPDGHPEGWR
ncbi:MAG TPA: hypothetical protein VE152_05255 [Acidimicrobiales bacterium]|nr:hypothetical protein [Acidimicrobiales bacterium]